MRIFADENVPGVVVVRLRAAGHDVSWGSEHGQGLSDAARLSAAIAEFRIVLTEDNDFAVLVLTSPLPVPGLIRFDLDGLGREAKARRILDGIAEVEAASTTLGYLSVIEPGRVRSRRLP